MSCPMIATSSNMSHQKKRRDGTRRESEKLMRDKEYATFCSISLTSEPRGSKSEIDEVARLQQQYLHGNNSAFPHKPLRVPDESVSNPASASSTSIVLCIGELRRKSLNLCVAIRRVRLFILLGCFPLFISGLFGVFYAAVSAMSADQYLFIGALVSCAFSLVVSICYLKNRSVRSHPNPLIFSKSLVDLFLAALYIFEYCATEFSSPPVVLPYRIAAVTQALLVCGEFWFFAMPIDMVQSITNPFTSYSYNIRVYWFYSILSGLVCGIVLYLLDDGDPSHQETCGKENQLPCSRDQNMSLERYFWFHENTYSRGYWWHHWISYHLWVLVYLIFATVCVIYIKRRLRRGLEETFDVRRRVLSSGLLTCWIYIGWSFLVLCLFIITDLYVVKNALDPTVFQGIINLSAFLHSARGGLNIIVWLVINSSSLHVLCFRQRMHRFASNELHSIEMGAISASSSGEHHSARTSDSNPLSTWSHEFALHEEQEEQEILLKPELNTALRKQMIQMATTGIVESVEHYHRLHRRIESNQTFHLDWQRSPQRELRQLSSSMSLSRVVATRNSTIQVVEANDSASIRGSNGNVGASNVGSGRGILQFLPLSMKEMQFYDFQPKLFATIRKLYTIDDATYVYAFRTTINERISEGRSGAFVFTTCDRKYLVKSMTSEEKNVLLSLLPSYLRYLKWNPKTLLPRFFGFHAMKMYGQIFYFVVMGNVLNTTEVIHRRYDIKGSWEDRNAPACVLGEKYRCSKCNRFFTFGATAHTDHHRRTTPVVVPCESAGAEHYPDVTLRDNDLKKRLKVDAETATMLVKQLTRDSNFLASMGIMDYSLLIGTHYSHFTISTAPTSTAIPKTLKSDKSKFSSQHGDVGSEYLHVLCSEDTPASAELPTSSLPALFNSESETLVRGHHRYRAHQVSGPSTYYFGLVDILQQWTLSKQIERVYKVHVLRKSARGVSAIAPKQYAARFQQKLTQLFVTTPPQNDHHRDSITSTRQSSHPDESPQGSILAEAREESSCSIAEKDNT